MRFLPTLYKHDEKPDSEAQEASETSEEWSTYDGTPEARYDTWYELGPQEANVSSHLFAIDETGIPEGASGNVPQSIGVDPHDSPQLGLKIAHMFIDLTGNKGVFVPQFASGQVSLTNPPFWYDGGAMEPMWQQPNLTSPVPEPWDQGLTLGFGPPIQTLQSSYVPVSQ